MSRHEYFALPYRGPWTTTTTYVRTQGLAGRVPVVAAWHGGKPGVVAAAVRAVQMREMPCQSLAHISRSRRRGRAKRQPHTGVCVFFSIFRTLSPTTESLTSPHLVSGRVACAVR
jgi:hypothetical protein